MAPRYEIPEPDQPDEGAPRGSLLSPGDVLAGRFEVEGRVAAGTMGAVYRARDLETEDPVALKIQHDRRVPADRFEREAEALASLDHPSIVRYVAHGRTPAGAAYLVMELLTGHTLAERMGSAMPIEAAVELTARIANALGAAHDLGIVHRDVKPANVFLVNGSLERVKLIDFGLTRLAEGIGGGDSDASRMVTPPGTMVGTPEYMAPEQISGSEEVDARADIFSLGCVLFECLTGRHPFHAQDVLALLSKIVYQEPPRLRDLVPSAPRELTALVERMLAKSPADRPHDAREVAAALEKIGGMPAPSRPTSYFPTGSALTNEELRLVSVIIATGTHGAELEERMVALRDVAERFGAAIALLPDGSIVASVTGTGDATDRVSFAARCALAMRRTLGRAPMSLATGRGEVSGSFPVGEAIDRAVLLARAAASDTHRALAEQGIRIDSATASLLDDRFEIETEGTVLRLRAELGVQAPPRTLLGRTTPFVGRAPQLTALRRAYHRSVSERSPRLVLVLGEPGIGKSRLAHELVRDLSHDRATRAPRAAGPAERRAAVETWVARGDPLRAGTPLRLLSELVRDAMRLHQRGEPVFARRQRIRDRVDRCLPWTSAERVAEFLGELAGVPFTRRGSVQLRAADSDPVLMGDQMRLAFEDWIRAECQRAPVVLVLDDLHWGDHASVHTLDGLLETLTDSPLFAVALARPDFPDTYPDLLRGPNVSRLALEELSAADIARLSRSALGARADDETIAWIAERAAGNPLFAEELVRAASEGRSGEASGAVVAMVQARLESLPAVTRRVLRAASVFGHMFHEEGVGALVGQALDPAVVEEELGALVDMELLHRRAGAEGDGELSFAHPLVQEAAYASLIEADRALGHRLAARWLHEHGERDAHILAMHHERAGEPRAAASWYARAAEQALEADDVRTVALRVARAVECGADPESVAALRLLEAEAHRFRGETELARDRAHEAFVALPEDDPARLRALAEWALAASRLGDSAPILDAAKELRRALFDDEVTRDLVLAAAGVATHLIVLGHAAEAQTLVVRLEMRARRLAEEDPSVAARLSLVRAWQAAHRGEALPRLRHFAEAVEFLERAGDVRNACRERVNLGAAFLELGQAERAEAEARLAIATAKRLGLDAVEALGERCLATALLAMGELDEAAEHARRALAMFQSRKNRRMETATSATLSRILAAAGDLEGALEASEAALTAGSALSDGCIAQAARAEVLRRAGRPEEGRVLAEAAIQTLDALGGIDEDEVHLRLELVEALAACGDWAAARRALRALEERVEARAATIDDPELRHGFSNEHPDHVRLSELGRVIDGAG